MITDKIKKSGLVLSVCFFGFMSLLDSSIINVSVPVISRYFNIGMGQASLINIAYFLALTSTLILFGKLGDRFGLKKLFMAGYIFFIAGSLVCGMASSLAMLVVSRFAQGLGGAMMYVTAIALIPKYIPVEERGKSLSLLMTACTLGIVLGPPLGGLITTYAGWRWIFLVNVPVGIVASIVSFIFIPRDEASADPDIRHFDGLGAFLLFVFIFLFCFVLNQGSERGWASPEMIVSAAVAAVSFILFVRRQKLARYPLVDLRFFKDSNFMRANWANMLAFAVFAGNNFLMPFFLTRAMGMPDDKAGFVLMAFPVVFIAANCFVGRIIDTTSLRFLCVPGAVGQAVAYAVFALTAGFSGIWPVILFLSLSGIAFAIFSAPINELVLNMAHEKEHGMVTGIFKSGTNFGVIAGVCLFELVFVHVVSRGAEIGGGSIFAAAISGNVLLHGFFTAYAVGAVINIIAAIFVFLVKEERKTN